MAAGLDFSKLLIPSPAALPAYQHFTAQDGSALGYRHYPAASDIDLMLIHGSGSDSRYLYPLAQALSGAGAANVYTPDLRGHGPAPQRRGDIDYISQLEDDLADFIEHLAARHGPSRRVVVGGHSSGGGLALRFAGSRYGHRAAGYLLLAPYLGHDAPTTRPNSGGWAKPNLARIIPLAMLNSFGIRCFNRTPVLDFDLPAAYRDGSETLSYSFRLMTGLAPRHYQRDLDAISAPLLVLVGAQDEAFRAQQFAPICQSWAPHAAVTVLDGVGHLGLVAEPGVAAEVGEWLGRL